MGIFKRIFKTELYKLNFPKINIIHLMRNQKWELKAPIFSL